MNASVRIEGLNEFHAAVRKADREYGTQLRKGLNEAAEVVGAAARPTVPVLSGALQRSIRARSTQREGRTVMGVGRTALYAGWIEFGGAVGRNKSIKRARVPEGRFLYPAFLARRAQVDEIAEQVITRVANQAGLY